MPTTARFRLGHIVGTPAALAALDAAGERPAVYLNRHLIGDWGDVDQAAWAANNRALRNGGRLLSAYPIGNGATLWILTEGNRSATTLLLPEDDLASRPDDHARPSR